MITSCAIRLANKDMITLLKQKLSLTLAAECGQCGAVKINSKELAKSLNDLLKETKILNDETEEIFSEILGKIIEPEPSFEEIEDWDNWDSENEKRKCTFLDGYETAMYIACDEVVLYCDVDCKCFIKDKKESTR